MSPPVRLLPAAAAALLTAVRAELPGSLIALDFDGTLAEITPHPDDAAPLAGAAALLRLLGCAGASVAIVTGRTVDSLLRVTGFAPIAGLVVYGLHGAERWQGGRLQTPETPAGLADLRVELTAALRDTTEDPACWLEDKRLSLVVHARLTRDPGRLLAELGPVVRRLAGAAGMEVRPGKDVLEVVLPGISKGTAIDELVAVERSAVLYAGDDTGDVPAFERVKAWGLRTGRPAMALAVTAGLAGPLSGLADLTLPGPDLLLAVLGRLLAQDSPPPPSAPSSPRR